MLESSPRKSSQSPTLKPFMLSVVGIQVILLVGTFILTPGYLIPFLNNPVARVFLVGLVIWELIGFILLFKFCPRNKVVAIIIATVVATPLTLTPMLGPAIVTIFNALGPIMDNPGSGS